MRDITLEDTIDIKFTTRRFSTGAPFALSGGVISAYPGNSTTQLTAGITLTADFDGVTGLSNVRVVATAANGYAAATDYSLVITTGTVDSVSVVGEVIGEFSIGRSAAAVDLANGTDGLGALSARIPAALTADGNMKADALRVGGTAQTGADVGGIVSSGTHGNAALKTLIDTVNTDLSNGTDGLGALKALIDTVNADLSNGTDGLGALKALIDTVDAVVDAILAQNGVIDTGTAQAVSSTSLTVRAAYSSAGNDSMIGASVLLPALGITGAITDWDNTTKVATVTWSITPTGTPTYVVFATAGSPEITTLVSDMATVLTRLSSARAGYLDNISVGAVAMDADLQTLLTRLSATRAGYLDNLSGGAAATVAGVLAGTIGDGAITVAQALKVAVAAAAGKISGAATATVTIRNTADSVDVIVATVDADGNRSSVSLTV